jgi:hypothetical protein
VVIDNKINQVIRTSPPANSMYGPSWERRELDAGGVNPVAIPELRSEGKVLREASECFCWGSEFCGCSHGLGNRRAVSVPAAPRKFDKTGTAAGATRIDFRQG